MDYLTQEDMRARVSSHGWGWDKQKVPYFKDRWGCVVDVKIRVPVIGTEITASIPTDPDRNHWYALDAVYNVLLQAFDQAGGMASA